MSLRVLFGAVLLSALLVRSARADCPMSADAELSRGFLAAVATQAMPAAQPAEPGSTLEVAAAVSARSDGGRADASPVGAALGGEAQLGRSGWRACAAADLAIERTTSASLAIGALMPLITSGIGVGARFDYQRELDLSARPEWLSARLTEARTHLSLAFLDLPLASATATARLQVMPVRVELRAAQLDASDGPTSVRTALETSMLRFEVEELDAAGVFEVFRLDAELTDAAPVAMAEAAPSWMTVTILSLSGRGTTWRYHLGGGMTSASGGDCGDEACVRGSYAAELGWRRAALDAGVRAARSTFFLGAGGVGLEDRLTGELGVRNRRYAIGGQAFVATTQRLGGESLGVTGGAAGQLALPFGHGLEASVRGQLARSFYAELDGLGRPVAGTALSLGAALSWRAGFQR